MQRSSRPANTRGRAVPPLLLGAVAALVLLAGVHATREGQGECYYSDGSLISCHLIHSPQECREAYGEFGGERRTCCDWMDEYGSCRNNLETDQLSAQQYADRVALGAIASPAAVGRVTRTGSLVMGNGDVDTAWKQVPSTPPSGEVSQSALLNYENAYVNVGMPEGAWRPGDNDAAICERATAERAQLVRAGRDKFAKAIRAKVAQLCATDLAGSCGADGGSSVYGSGRWIDLLFQNLSRCVYALGDSGWDDLHQSACVAVGKLFKEVQPLAPERGSVLTVLWSGMVAKAKAISLAESGAVPRVVSLEGSSLMGRFFDGPTTETSPWEMFRQRMPAQCGDGVEARYWNKVETGQLWQAISKVFVKSFGPHPDASRQIVVLQDIPRMSSVFFTTELPQLAWEYCKIKLATGRAPDFEIDIVIGADCEAKLEEFKTQVAKDQAAGAPGRNLRAEYMAAGQWDLLNTLDGNLLCEPSTVVLRSVAHQVTTKARVSTDSARHDAGGMLRCMRDLVRGTESGGIKWRHADLSQLRTKMCLV